MTLPALVAIACQACGQSGGERMSTRPGMDSGAGEVRASDGSGDGVGAAGGDGGPSKDPRVRVFPDQASVRPGGSLVFTSHISEGNQLTTWSIVEPNCGSLVAGDNFARFVAPLTSGVVCTVRARSVVWSASTDTWVRVSDDAKSDLLIFPEAPDQGGFPSAVPVGVGMSQSYLVVEDLASVAPVEVQWSTFYPMGGVMPVESGTVRLANQAGLILFVTAADGRATSVRIVVQATGSNVAIDPPTSRVAPGQNIQFSATIPGVGWRVTGTPGATISATGMFTAPPAPGVCGVVASSPDGVGRGGAIVVVR
jgi:hypothetical protein